MLRVLFGTSRAVNKMGNHAAELSALPMAEFLPKWVEIMSTAATGAKPLLHPPASREALELAQATLQCPLPDELKEFYLLANGIGWVASDYNTDVVALGALVPSAHYQPALSAQVRKDWEDNGRDDGEPEGITVFSTSIIKLMIDAHEHLIPFSDVDEMLSLEAPDSGEGAVIVVKSHPQLPIGAVLKIENHTATCYGSMRAWLASSAATIAMIQGLARRGA